MITFWCLCFLCFYLDARITQIWWLAAIIAHESAANGAETRKAILAPNLLGNTYNWYFLFF